MEAEAKHDFVPGDPATELAFKKGDRLLILNFGDPVQWYSAQKNGQTGLVPGNYIEVRNADWYYGRISRLTAENVLMSSAHHEGAFLVRLSESSPNDFSLSVKCGEAVQHFRILKSREHRYFLWTTEFDSINALVEHYKTESVSKSKPIYLRDMDSETFMAEAIYDFEPKDDAEDGETELGFKKGDLIQVFDCRDENWWGGRIGERTGFFPKLYVKKQDLRPFKN